PEVAAREEPLEERGERISLQPRRLDERDVLVLRAHGDEVREDPPAGSRRDALGMELDAEKRPLAVLERHDDAVRGVRGLAERLRERRSLGAERVVPRRRERARDAVEHWSTLVADLARLPVDDRAGSDDAAALGLDDRPVPEAHAEHGD